MTAETPQAALVLDCRGLLCPRPVIELGLHYAEVAIGEVIAVVADDGAAAHDIPAWCRMRGQEFAGTTHSDEGAAVYLVQRLS